MSDKDKEIQHLKLVNEHQRKQILELQSQIAVLNTMNKQVGC